MPEVLEPDDLGQLILIRSSLKCLNLNPIMPEILAPDDLGQLTLIRSSLRCLNLNPIMTEVLAPDDLVQLTLIRSSHKCLNLNPIMPEILRLNDLNGLASQYHAYRYLWGQFLLQGQGLDLWSLRHFCCPTLERLPSSFYLIMHEPMVEEYHQFG